MFKIGDIISLKKDKKSSIYNSIYKISNIEYDNGFDPVYCIYDVINKFKIYISSDIINLSFELNPLYLRKKKLKRICSKLGI